ncbi:hypothetical protein ACLKA6_005160 [Drosophila palustris]
MNDLHTLCRTCGITINEDLAVKLFEEINYPLVTLIEDITDMWIEHDDVLPEYICIDCKEMLDQIVVFRAKCLSTHKKLLAVMKNDINRTNDLIILSDVNSDLDGDIKEEFISNDSEHIDSNDEQPLLTESESDNRPQLSNEEIQQSIQSYVKNKPTKKTIKKRNNDRHLKTWICEQCGGEFKCSTYFKLHLLRHTDKKEFECDVCKKKYYTRNEMLRHKILHTNARPYACRFCDKTFRGTSSKAVHERSHTNERPFPCQYCEKAFRSTSVRRAHERIHVNNRKFHCEPCDQWFLRSSHLLLHQRTKLHKTAVRVRRLLWDKTDSGHNNLKAVKAAWQSVSAEMGRDPNDCKVAWRSLRQSYRYHCKAANNRFKSGGHDDDDEDDHNDDEAEADPLETPDVQWQFFNHMAFLQEVSRVKRSDSVTLEEESPTSNSVLEDYTDAEYLETYDEGDDVNYTTEDDADYLTKSSKDEDKRGQPKITKNDVLCRTCTQPTDVRTSQNLFKPYNYKLLRDIKELTDLQLKRDEDFSDLICGHCQEVLEIATEFRRVCIEAQTQVLIKVQIKDEAEEMEMHSPEPSNSDLGVEEEQLEFLDISDNEIYYEEVDKQPLPSAKAQPKIRTKSKKPLKSFKFQCHECGLTFGSQDLLKMHMHQMHNMQLHTRFVCKHCGHDFKYSAPLVEHLKSIGVKFGYECEECDQKFHSRFFLKKHKRRIHGLADEHICHICGKNFTTGFNLRNHIVRHAGTRPHKCNLCSAAFSTTAELNNHKRTHDNVRPYPCRYGCGKSFRHCSNRSTHERVHMDGSLRPFQCEYCDKSFVTKGDCRAHQVVHTMSRDYNCDICEQSFKLQKHYQQHLTTKSHKKVEALAQGPKTPEDGMA